MATQISPLILSAQDCLRIGGATNYLAEPEGDCDCACPLDDPGSGADVSRPIDNSTPLMLVRDLYLDHLDETFGLAYDPCGRHGVVVLDARAMALLAQFTDPRALAQITPHLQAAAQRLTALGLIVPTDDMAPVLESASRTLTVWMHVTNECNLRCDYCYVHKSTDKLDAGRGRDSVEAVFRSAVAHGFKRVKLKYAGGEASLNLPVVVEAHEHAQNLATRHGITLRGVLLSNGVAIGRRVIAEVRRLGLGVVISLDGVGALHDSQRAFANRGGSFAHVERSLDRLTAANVQTSISITLTARNLAGLGDTVTYVLRRGLPFSINFYRENDCGAAYRDLNFSDERLIAAMHDAFARIATAPPRRSLLTALTDRARLNVPHALPCGVGRSYIVVDQRGGIAACQMEIERTVGEITSPDPLTLIQESPIGIRNIPVMEKSDCRSCAWRFQCAGGCPALTQRVYGVFDHRSPYCNIYRTLFPEVLRLEARRILAHAA